MVDSFPVVAETCTFGDQGESENNVDEEIINNSKTGINMPEKVFMLHSDFCL